jgi:hypothetical protein
MENEKTVAAVEAAFQLYKKKVDSARSAMHDTRTQNSSTVLKGALASMLLLESFLGTSGVVLAVPADAQKDARIGYFNLALGKSIGASDSRGDSLACGKQETIRIDLRNGFKELRRIQRVSQKSEEAIRTAEDEWLRDAYAKQSALNQITEAHLVRADARIRAAVGLRDNDESI